MTKLEQVREVFSRFEGSGLSMEAFAAREDIPYTTAQYWRRRPGGGGKRAAERQKAVVLSPVRVVPDTPAPAERKGFEMWLSNGVSLEVPPGFDEGELQRLVGVLSGCAACRPRCASSRRAGRRTCASRSTRWRRWCAT